MTDELLTPAEVAEILQLNVHSVYRLMRSNKLAHFDFGHRTKRVRRSVLDAYIAAREGTKCS